MGKLLAVPPYSEPHPRNSGFMLLTLMGGSPDLGHTLTQVCLSIACHLLLASTLTLFPPVACIALTHEHTETLPGGQRFAGT